MSDGPVVIVPVDGPTRRLDGIGQGSVDSPGTLPVDHPPDRAIAWSRDGLAIALARSDGVWLVSTDKEGAVRRLTDVPAFSVSWSPDSTRLVVGIEPDDPEPGMTEAADVIDATDGRVMTSPSVGCRDATWSPTDDLIAAACRDGNVVVRPDGTRVALIGCGYNLAWSPDGQLLMCIRDAGGESWDLVIAEADGTGVPEIVTAGVAIRSARASIGPAVVRIPVLAARATDERIRPRPGRSAGPARR